GQNNVGFEGVGIAADEDGVADRLTNDWGVDINETLSREQGDLGGDCVEDRAFGYVDFVDAECGFAAFGDMKAQVGVEEGMCPCAAHSHALTEQCAICQGQVDGNNTLECVGKADDLDGAVIATCIYRRKEGNAAFGLRPQVSRIGAVVDVYRRYD